MYMSPSFKSKLIGLPELNRSRHKMIRLKISVLSIFKIIFLPNLLSYYNGHDEQILINLTMVRKCDHIRINNPLVHDTQGMHKAQQALPQCMEVQ